MSEEQDRMSALPDAILHQILSFLPTKHSIQTSILSKRWINLWKFTPVIDIPITGPQDITQSDCTFIDNTLAKHQALKLHKFSLEFSAKHFPYPKPDVQRCIEFALSRQVQILSVSAHLLCLAFALPVEHYVLPDMFYSHDNIQSLEQVLLKGLLFYPNQPRVRFASLNTLCFVDCVIDDETLMGLISNCPVLESLTIDSCYGLLNFKASWCQSMRLKHLVLKWRDELWTNEHVLNLEIDVSTLSTFKFCGDLMRISLGSLPSIVEVTVFNGRLGPYGQELEHINTWLRNLAHVKKLGVNSWFTQFLAIEHQMNSSRLKIFENLEVFSWFGDLVEESDLIVLIAFLGHCPSLEKIEIDFRSYYWNEVDERNQAYARERSFIELNNRDGQPTFGYLHNLKTIMVHHFFGYKSEIEFIKHLLQKAVVLATLSLTYHRLKSEYSDGYLNRPKESVEEEIFSLPRASSHVDILFH